MRKRERERERERWEGAQEREIAVVREELMRRETCTIQNTELKQLLEIKMAELRNETDSNKNIRIIFSMYVE